MVLAQVRHVLGLEGPLESPVAETAVRMRMRQLAVRARPRHGKRALIKGYGQRH